ncbi:ZDHHC11 [Symbiodinium natans]|uniref:Palmitoyltransferase n=1 Tax=Symbiodinium natans TaxID=878477 RepID=A0A812UQC2_9DINO|nr:ZDHHC11 [Symbiodinium natans]
MPPSLPRRRNAWDCPPSKRQVVTIGICIGNAVAFVMFLFPLLYEPYRLLFSIIFGFSFVLTAVFGIFTMTVDPMDLNVSRAEEGLQPEHDAMAYCKNCRVNVQLDSKHCWDCNKCVSNYDHHCPWLNTCIGTRNYFYFYVSIWSLLVMLATSSTADVLVIVEHARDSTNALGLGSVLVWLISIILALVDIPLCFLDSTLVAFHTYLCVLDITTYDYLTGKTSQKKARWKEQRECETHEGREVQRSDLAVRNRRMLDAVPHFGGAPAPNRRPDKEEELEDSSVSSSAESSDGSYSEGGGAVFRSFVAQEGDTEVKKEVSNFVFGSSVREVEEPQMSPTPTIPAELSLRANVGRDNAV